jgi:hypothetical protein
MDIETLFVDSKWRILSELSLGAMSPTELAKKTGTSAANISAQLRLLEAMDLIQEEKHTNISKGEARKTYSLKKEFAYLVISSRQSIGKRMIKLTPDLMIYFNVWLINDSEIPPMLVKLWVENEIIFKNTNSFGYVGFKEELEILIISDNTQEFSDLNNKSMMRNEKQYKIKAHVYTKEVFEDSIKNKDDHIVSLLKKVFIILDKDSFLSKLKRAK